MFFHLMIGALAGTSALTSASELINGECEALPSTGSVLLQKGRPSALIIADSSPIAPGSPDGTVLGIELPAMGATWMLSKMILPDPWKCKFYNFDFRVCDKDVNQAGLVPGAITQSGRMSHEYINYPRVFLPLGSVPCCPTPPFCSAPKCSESFALASMSAPAPVCSKRSGAENFAYMTGQMEWPAYMAFCGGYTFDVHKHWDVLGRTLGCNTLQTCSNAETVDLVIDLGSNFGMITEELTNRHFGKSYIMIDAAPGLAQHFANRHANKAWREEWFKQQVPARAHARVPEYEFHQFGISNIPGTIDACRKFGLSMQPCPVKKASPDAIIPAMLSDDFKVRFREAQSAFVKIDIEGYDALAMQGMTKLFSETRGVYADGSDKYLINFLMVEYAPELMATAKVEEKLVPDYDLKNMTSLLEARGFEVFLTGPRYLPLTHGSWDDRYLSWFSALGSGKTAPQCPKGAMYPWWRQHACPGATCDCTFATDLFAMRANHPKAAEIKVALGACSESKDFDLADEQYDMSQAAQL